MMSGEIVTVLVVYSLVGFGAALGTVPRDFFKHPIERFVVRVSCGLVWPVFAGYVLVHRTRQYVQAQEDGKSQS